MKTRIFLLLGCFLVTPAALASSISVGNLSAAPTLDGSGSDWSGVKATSIALKNNKAGGKSDIASIDIKGGVFGDTVYFLLQWKDDSMDDQHKPFVWDADNNKYEAGPQREDRLAIQFAMGGDYDVNWLSGKAFTADMWHWKAARSNPAGVAHDKSTAVGTSEVSRAYKASAENGKTIYIQRPSDAGDSLYKTTRYREKEQDMMPKYLVNTSPHGSIADVKAKGVWSDGMWTLELSRKLNTGNPDDVVFGKGKSVMGAIAVFNHSGNDDHNLSDNISFNF